MMNLSFVSVNEERVEENKSVRPVSNRQVSYYLNLCKQKRQRPVNYIEMTYDELSDEIQRLKNIIPASDKQIELIKDKIEQLNNAGRQITPPNYDELTGGRDGTASRLIEELIKIEQEVAKTAPPTKGKVEFMVSMYLCVDIPFEDYGISRKIDLGDGLWRRLTPTEFAEEIINNFTDREAQAFISKYKSKFYQWKNSRLTQNQINHIRTLEGRLSNLNRPSIIEERVDLFGNVERVKVDNDNNRWDSPGYEPLDELSLSMLSKETANELIQQMEMELRIKESTFQSSDLSETFEEIRTKEDDEYQKLLSLMFKLEAVAGYKDDELHDSVVESLITGVDSDTIREHKAKIRGFMLSLIETDCIDVDGLLDMIEDIPSAKNILIGL